MLIVVERLHHFGPGVHDKRATARDRLVQASGRNDQESCICVAGGNLDPVTIGQNPQTACRQPGARGADRGVPSIA